MQVQVKFPFIDEPVASRISTSRCIFCSCNNDDGKLYAYTADSAKHKKLFQPLIDLFAERGYQRLELRYCMSCLNAKQKELFGENNYTLIKVKRALERKIGREITLSTFLLYKTVVKRHQREKREMYGELHNQEK